MINSPVNLTEDGVWAHKIYGVNPIFLALSLESSFNKKDSAIFEVEIDVDNLVADLPSLIDYGAYINDADESTLYWINNTPEIFKDYCDEEEYEFDAYDFLKNKNLIKAAIKLTNTAASLDSISSDKINLIKR